LVGLAVLTILLQFYLWIVPALKARRLGLSLSVFDMIAIRLLKLSPGPIIDALGAAKAADLDVSLPQVQTHALAGGDVRAVVAAMAQAKAKNIPCTWPGVTAADLAGIDPVAAVSAGVDPQRVVGSAEFAGRFRRGP